METLSKELLEKYNLKEIPFADLLDGEEFNTIYDFVELYPQLQDEHGYYRRKLQGAEVVYADGTFVLPLEFAKEYTDEIVYVRA